MKTVVCYGVRPFPKIVDEFFYCGLLVFRKSRNFIDQSVIFHGKRFR